MAFTVTQRAVGSDTTSATSFNLGLGSITGNIASPSWAVLIISVDNSDTGGGAHGTFTVTDSAGNTWTRRISPLFDPGLANAGVEGAIFTTPLNGGTITSGTTITVTFGVATPRKAWMLYEVAAGGTVSYVTGGVNTGAATGSPTITTASITSGDLVIAGGFNERGDSVFTGDGDSTNGTWANGVNLNVASGAGGNGDQNVIVQYKITTGTGTQQWDPTLTPTTSDIILGYIVLNEAAANVTVTPTTAALVLTTFAPTVTTGAAVTVTPTTAALVLSTFAPTVTATLNRLVTPTTATLNLSTFAPTVTATGAFAQGVGGFMVIG